MFFYFLLLFGLLILLSQPFIFLLHELGHAIPLLVITRKPVTVFVGSYGSTEKSIRIPLRLLTIWLYRNPFVWHRRGGLCIPSAKAPVTHLQILLYTAAGPAASFLVASICLYFTFSYDLHGLLKLFLVALLLAAIVDLVRNFYPNPRPVLLADGSITQNDGYKIRQAYKWIRHKKAAEEASRLVEKKQFEKAVEKLEYLLKAGLTNRSLYQPLIGCLLETGQNPKALRYHEVHAAQNGLDTYDYCHLALLHADAGEQDACLQADNVYALNNKGFYLAEWGRWEEGLAYAENVLALDPGFSHGYGNRAYCRIKLGQLSEGHGDLLKALELDPANAYVHRNFGVYHLALGEKDKANHYFQKAKELKPNTYGVDGLLREAEAS